MNYELRITNYKFIEKLKNNLQFIIRNKIIYSILFLVIFSNISFSEELKFRICLSQTNDIVKIKANDEIKIYGEDENTVFSGNKEDVFTIKPLNTTPAKIIYRIGVKEFSKEKLSDAVAFSQKLADMGFSPIVKQYGGELKLNDKIINNNSRWWVLINEYMDYDTARTVKEQLNLGCKLVVLRTREQLAQGIVELKTPEEKLIQFNNFIRFKSQTPITILDLEYSKGYSWAGKEDRKYRGEIEVGIDNDGKLLIVNIVGADDYLKGVVPSEIGETAPLEAQKAQAIAARSETIAKIGVQHAADSFDMCAEVCCQVYSGLNKEYSQTNKAVEETSGIVICYGENIVDAVYSSHCSGHTENNENVWWGEPIPYLRGVIDGDKKCGFKSPLKEKDYKKWFRGKPNVFCNTNNPIIPKWAWKNFRWKIVRKRETIEKRLKEYADIGSIKSIKVISRGVSGMVLQVEVTGTQGKYLIDSPTLVRKIFWLKSANFIYTLTYKKSGMLSSITFVGGGWGHGVGMCQTGAIAMAGKGYGYEKILKHYYTGIELKKIY